MKIDGIYNRKEAGAGIEPANSGFADRDLTTWLPRRLRRTETNASAWSVKSVQFGVGRSRMGVRRCPTLVSLNARSLQLSRTAQQRIPGGVNSPVRAFRHVGAEPFFIERAQGAKIWDIDGNEYIDYVGSWGPAILGHAPKVIVDAVREAAARGISFGIPNPFEVEMAELICTWMPSIEKVRMVNSGTEATMSCIRLARGFTGRDKIIKFDGCYHGHVDALLVKSGSGALTHGRPDSAGIPQAFINLTISLPFNRVDLVRKAFRENKNEIAAVILEPIPANAGLYFPSDDFLPSLREECDKHGTVLIFDEVMTGFRIARGGCSLRIRLTTYFRQADKAAMPPSIICGHKMSA